MGRATLRRAPPPPQLRAEIALRAAVAVFGAQGFHSTTMDDVARTAGMTKPMLYEHFSSKDTLFEAVVESECNRLLEHLFATYAKTLDRPIPERLRAGIAAFFEFAERSPGSFFLIFDSSSLRLEAVVERVDATVRAITDRVAEMIRRDMRRFGTPAERSADVLATMLVGMIVETARRHEAEGRWNAEAVVDLLAAFETAGLFGIGKDVCAAIDRTSTSEEAV